MLRLTGRVAAFDRAWRYHRGVADTFDPAAMVLRFQDRARAVRERRLPPVEGVERQRLRQQAQLDYQDFAMLGDAEVELVDGILTLRVDLRPRPEPNPPDR